MDYLLFVKIKNNLRDYTVAY